MKALLLVLLPLVMWGQEIPESGTDKVKITPRQSLQRFGAGIGLGIRWVPGVHWTPGSIVNPLDGTSLTAFFESTAPRSPHAGFLAEVHYFVWRPRHVGVGPFFGFQPGTDQIVAAIGGGGMLAWRFSRTGNEGIALGVGYAAVPSVRNVQVTSVVVTGTLSAAPAFIPTHTAGAPLLTLSLIF